VQILHWVAHDADSTPHPSCTAMMGIDPMFVTGPQGMGAHDEGDDLTLGNQPQAPATMPLYRHRPSASEPVRRN
jgi:choline dehydrogenase